MYRSRSLHELSVELNNHDSCSIDNRHEASIQQYNNNNTSYHINTTPPPAEPQLHVMDIGRQQPMQERGRRDLQRTCVEEILLMPQKSRSTGKALRIMGRGEVGDSQRAKDVVTTQQCRVEITCRIWRDGADFKNSSLSCTSHLIYYNIGHAAPAIGENRWGLPDFGIGYADFLFYSSFFNLCLL